MFGLHEVPFSIEKERISLSVEQAEEILIYKRKCGDEEVEKFLLAFEGNILINPIEPLQKPKEITPYLLIEFDKKLLVEPKATQKVYIKFPIEIGIFISGKKDFEVLDIVTLAKQKFTLYGDPRSGVICKDWRSDVYSSIPPVDSINEGVIELNISNMTAKWAEVTKSIFNAYGMKIYYNEELVSMKANMKILTKATAETDFIDSPLEQDMNKSLELYTVKKLPITTKKFVMREGL